MGPEMLSKTGAGVWIEAPVAFPDSSSVCWINFSLRFKLQQKRSDRYLSQTAIEPKLFFKLFLALEVVFVSRGYS